MTRALVFSVDRFGLREFEESLRKLEANRFHSVEFV